MNGHYSWIYKSRASNAAAVDLVRSVLMRQETPTDVRNFPSCQTIFEALYSLDSPSQVGVVTSYKAFEAYDTDHPERIACILIKSTPPTHYYVIMNNRELDIERIVRFWRTATFDAASECVVCMRSLLPPKNRKKNKTGLPHTRCAFCYASLCVTCLDKLKIDDCHKCPVCRQWALDGGDFGVPWTADIRHAAESRRVSDADAHAIDILCDRVLCLLDGHVFLIVRIDDTFRLDSVFEMAKLARTNRYSERSGGDHISTVRKEVKRICDDALRHTSNIQIWLRRKTFGIDRTSEKPIEEVSVFRVQSAHRLQQLHPDAWVDVVLYNLMLVDGEDEASYLFCPRKTAYLHPHEFTVPARLRDILKNVAQEHRRPMTVSVVIENAAAANTENGEGKEEENGEKKASKGMNFDVDERLNVTTAHEAFVSARFAVLSDDARELLLTVRIMHDDPHTCDALSYRYHVVSGDIVRLAPGESEVVIGRDVDGLLGTRSITRFL